MKILQYIYKTSTLASNGIFLLLLALILMLIGPLLIPAYKAQHFKQQIFTLNGLAIKYDDDPAVSDFIYSIKKNDGYLCMGTSESSDLEGGNYYSFLNADTSLHSRFSILAGAGRTCGIYIPLLLQHRDEVDSMQIIYLINPAYWRTDLCEVNMEYWNRYTNYAMIHHVKLTENENQEYFKPVQAYLTKLNLFQRTVFSIDYELRSLRKSYFQDFRYLLNDKDYRKNLSFISTQKAPLSTYPSFGQIDAVAIDTSWNLLRTFHNQAWFKPIQKDSKYRFEELSSFIEVCKHLGIKATFVIGPYNGRFITKYDKKSLAAYEETCQRIKTLLIDKKADFIDATDVSFVAGAFNDHQHHSSYGAYLLYLKIKSHINESPAD
jgi:hypothetical protein